MKLDAKALGLSIGLIWGAAVALVTLACVLSGQGYGVAFLNGIVSIYPGFCISTAGIFIGLVYGFIDGFILGWLIAKLYNIFVK